ncbi:MAG: MbtH domain protein [Candidatus Aminicenantes bacterium]|nr:MbtH domain protein [Candidatus Aminicenantes bacterium]
MAEKKLNELVERLTKEHDVETARPEKTAKALKECIDRDYVHVMFIKTGTELGVQLYRPDCNFTKADFDNASGKVHLEGGLILNYDKVRCTADIDLSTCEGKGRLVPVGDEEYEAIMGKKKE